MSNRPKGTQLDAGRLDLNLSFLGSEEDVELGRTSGFGVLAINTGSSVDLCEHLDSLSEALHVGFRIT